VTDYRLSRTAVAHLTDIYLYSEDEWGATQADKYLDDFYNFFGRIVAKNIMWRPLHAELEVTGYFARCNLHFVYWRELGNGDMGIVAILHKRRHQISRLREAFDLSLK